MYAHDDDSVKCSCGSHRSRVVSVTYILEVCDVIVMTTSITGAFTHETMQTLQEILYTMIYNVLVHNSHIIERYESIIAHSRKCVHGPGPVCPASDLDQHCQPRFDSVEVQVCLKHQ